MSKEARNAIRWILKAVVVGMIAIANLQLPGFDWRHWLLIVAQFVILIGL